MNRKFSLKATAIGSLPHNNPQIARELILRNFPDIPFWPQLSNLNPLEDMTKQYSERLPGLIYDKNEDRYYIDSTSESFYEELEEFMTDYETIVEDKNLESLEKYAISENYASTLRSIVKESATKDSIALKGQIIGSFTYSTMLTDSEKKAAYYDITLKETIEKFLCLKAIWQLEYFKKYSPNKNYIMFIDEPSISQYGSSAFLGVTKKDITESLNFLADKIKEFGGISAVHCCGNTDWSIITSSNVNILSFDAYNFADSLTLYPDDINKYIEKGGMLAWGLVPTLDPAQVEKANAGSLIEIFNTTIDHLTSKGIDKEKLIDQSLVTPSCGTGSLSEILAEKALELTYNVSCSLRSIYKR